MTPEQFLKWEKGDMLFYYGDDFEIESIDNAFHSELKVAGPYQIYDALGRSLKISDSWLDEVQIMHAAYQDRPPGYLRRLEFVIFGIDEDSSSWTFILERVEGIIAEYGGYIVEIDG